MTSADDARRQVLVDAYNALTDNPSPERVDEVLARVWEQGAASISGDEPTCVCSPFDVSNPDCPQHGMCASLGHPCACGTTESRRWAPQVPERVYGALRWLVEQGQGFSDDQTDEAFRTVRDALEGLSEAGLATGAKSALVEEGRALRDWGRRLLLLYPEEVFVPPTPEEYDRLHRARGATGVTVDAFSADVMRRAARLAIEDGEAMMREASA